MQPTFNIDMNHLLRISCMCLSHVGRAANKLEQDTHAQAAIDDSEQLSTCNYIHVTNMLHTHSDYLSENVVHACTFSRNGKAMSQIIVVRNWKHHPECELASQKSGSKLGKSSATKFGQNPWRRQ